MRKLILLSILIGLSISAQNPIFLNETYTTGLVNIGKASDIFFWHFESRNIPSQDPLVFWLTGGPGCSSELALFTENGPFTVNDDLSLQSNAFAWNQNANLVFVDQPVGTGFSNAGKGELVKNEEEVGQDFYEFVVGFLNINPQYKGRPVFITGESYAGHYIPAVGTELVKKANKDINLIGLAIGNGWVNPKVQQSAYGEFAYENKLISALKYYAFVKPVLAVCEGLITINAPLFLSQTVCGIGYQAIVGNGPTPKFNVYDIRKPCIGSLCYNMTNVDNFLARQDVKNALGVPTRTWSECSNTVYNALNHDENVNLAVDVAYVLENNVKVLVYSGDKDFQCNYIGGLHWTHAMEWSQQAEFQKAKFSDYIVDGQKAGQIKGAGNLHFLRVFNAGHMVPMDQPSVALYMLNTFTQNK